MDLTSLNSTDNAKTIEALVDKVRVLFYMEVDDIL